MVLHTTGQGSESPTPGQMIEFYRQVESGLMTKSRFQVCLHGSTHGLGLAKAEKIMGKKNFFGPEQWTSFFGRMVDKTLLARIPNISWSEEELRNSGLSQPHFLRLGMPKLDSKPLNLPLWRKIFSDKNKHPRFYLDWYLRHLFAQSTCEFRWYLDVVGIAICFRKYPTLDSF